jgi:DNA repair photolyase
MQPIQPTIKGRGAAIYLPNRFERLQFEADPDAVPFDEEGESPPPQTIYLRDSSRTIITRNDSPDIPFAQSVNVYRGCTHGCIYCFARPGHEYLGYSAGLDFETKIVVKENAPELLRKELSSPRYRPDSLNFSGVTDCYQPVERKLALTRRCLQVCAEFRNPVTIITKNHLVTRDLDVLMELAAHQCVAVLVSVTTLNPDLTRVLEPRTSVPKRRLAAIEALANAGVPIGTMVAPVIPGLTDEEVPAILAAAANAGARFAGTTALRLPYAVAPLFEDWLARHYPDRKEKILNRVRAMRGGKLNDPNFGSRFQPKGVMADQVATMFKLAARRAGIDGPFPKLSTEGFRVPSGPQLSLFE